MEHGELLQDMTFLMENCENEYYNKEDMVGLLFECLNELLELFPGPTKNNLIVKTELPLVHKSIWARIFSYLSFMIELIHISCLYIKSARYFQISYTAFS